MWTSSTFRENTEDLYAGIEHTVGNVAESIKVITREGTERICRLAFERSTIEEALKSPENRTKGLGGSAGTKEFAQAVISNL